MLRIDVDGGEPYGIPADNPFVGEEGARPEIWDLGLRNPWRFSFDRETGDLWVGDVGQGLYEEIDAEPAGSGGRNYGWSVMEGPECFRDAACDQDGLTLPVAWYGREEGCVVAGGHVYRGAAFPALRGIYLYADMCRGTVWGLDAATAVSTGTAEPVLLGDTDRSLVAFGEDEAGELYAVDIGGAVTRITASPAR
jgi:glucose/arabinose dehydrogenase